MEQMVIETRKRLEKKLYAQTGALAISYALRKEGINPPPIVTINKIWQRIRFWLLFSSLLTLNSFRN